MSSLTIKVEKGKAFGQFFSRIFRNPGKYSELEAHKPALQQSFEDCLDCPRAILEERIMLLQSHVAFAGSKKIVDPDMIGRFRGEWASFSEGLLTSLAQKARDTDRSEERILNSKIREAKIASLLYQLQGVVLAVDLSAAEKRELVSRFAGVLGAPSVQPSEAPKKPEKAAAAPKKKTAAPAGETKKVRSEEETRLLKEQSEASAALKKASKEAGGVKLPGDHPLVVEHRRAIDALHHFRHRRPASAGADSEKKDEGAAGPAAEVQPPTAEPVTPASSNEGSS